MNVRMTADKALRILAGAYAQYGRGQYSDRVAHMEAVVIDRQLTVTDDANFT